MRPCDNRSLWGSRSSEFRRFARQLGMAAREEDVAEVKLVNAGHCSEAHCSEALCSEAEGDAQYLVDRVAP